MHIFGKYSDEPGAPEDLCSSDGLVRHDPVLRNAAPEAPAPRFGDTAPICDPHLATFDKSAKTPAEPEIARPVAPKVHLWKRSLDITCILLSAPCWVPAMILIAIWIKIVSPGAILFRQERIGHRGRRFMILKFRTMKVNVETLSHERHLEQLMRADCPMTKLDAAGDPRVIRGGRSLRATGLDELPQLFNVLRGEMSLVGPRPCTPHEFQHYESWHRERVNALPGLTGYWQVNGKNGTTFSKMIDLDVYYARNLSLRMDLAIMLKTLPVIAQQFFESPSR